VEIDLACLRHNLAVLQRCGEQQQLLGVIKANAYGHGAVAVAHSLRETSVAGWAVALLEEALELRAAGIDKPIVLLGRIHGADAWREVIKHAVTPVLHDREQVTELAQVCRVHASTPLAVHMEIDTGMRRLGALPRDVTDMLVAFHQAPQLALVGVMSHFVASDNVAISQTSHQCDQFFHQVAAMQAAGFAPRHTHVANSAALLRRLAPTCSMARPGLALYGVSPLASPDSLLRPALRWVTQIVALREVSGGDTVGYGGTWRARRRSRIATLAAGYADGLSRALSNCGHVLLHGQRVPLVGVISMDVATVDVTDLDGSISLGDEVVVIGSQQGRCGHGSITASEMATWAQTIPWEILTSISQRVSRVYVSSDAGDEPGLGTTCGGEMDC